MAAKKKEKIFNEEDITIPDIIKGLRADARDDCEKCPMVSGYGCLSKIFHRVKELAIFTDPDIEESFQTCTTPGIDCDEEGYCQYWFCGKPECQKQMMRELAKMIWQQTRTEENPYRKIEGAYREGE